MRCYNIYHIVWNNMSDQGKDFITQLLTKDQNKRPTAQEALNHPWIKQANQQSKDNL